MKTARTICFALTAAVITLLAAPEIASAQGCPWCTTPTKCEGIEENSPLERCYVQQGVGCVEVEGESECIYQVWLAPSTRDTFLASHGIEYHGTRTVEVAGIQLEAFVVDDSLVAIWGCDGEVSLLWRQQADGKLQDARFPDIRSRYTLRPVGGQHGGNSS